ncbi:hypothetical protein [Candidatus Thiosymbion oneisti]|uniref:hypothetical protein n=1 Tax=Candidatus Thiosymbion oneisti TaxID=589554 RepID=UPI001062048D|nr:hypothetical protein [Candidatus Thiosymbion oneisti]
MADINIKELGSDIINALVPHVISGSHTLANYKFHRAKLVAEFTESIAKQLKAGHISEKNARNFLRDRERLEIDALETSDIIETSTRVKAVEALMKVVQGAINSATGLSISIF